MRGVCSVGVGMSIRVVADVVVVIVAEGYVRAGLSVCAHSAKRLGAAKNIGHNRMRNIRYAHVCCGHKRNEATSPPSNGVARRFLMAYAF